MQPGPDKKTLLLQGQVDLLFSAIPNSAVANCLGALIAYSSFRQVIPPIRLFPWLALLLAITLLRTLHFARYRSARPQLHEIGRWFAQFRLLSLLLAAAVGSAGFLLFDYDDTIYQLVLALMLVCITSFAITTMAPSPDLAVAFIILLLSPLAGSLLLTHANENPSAIWIIPLTVTMLIISATRISKNIVHNIELTIKAQQHENEMKDFQQRLALYFHATPLAVLEIGPTGDVLQWNPAAEKLFGYTGAEAEGQQLITLVASTRSHARLQSLWSEMLQNRSSQQMVLENRNKDGHLRECEWFNTPLIDSAGSVIGIIALIQDVTSREENDRIKQEFISVVSHELRTPVTAIKGSLGLLVSGLLDNEPAEARAMLKIALENTNRLHLLVNDILNVEKLESGKLDYQFNNSDINDLLQQVINANTSLAQQNSIVVEFSSSPEPLVVHMDADRIFQVITNLLANAIKFAHPGSTVTLAVGVAASSVRVSVRNYGEVIGQHDRGKMFSKFFQRDSTTTRAKEGSGLGLYISKKILERHQSTLDFSSSAEQGTSFFFELPLVPT